MSGALTGFLSAVGAVLVSVAGSWLYHAVPAERRKKVAAKMMVVGGLMLASVLLRQWGVVEQGPLTDGLVPTRCRGRGHVEPGRRNG